MTTAHVELGPFLLQECIGRGGMGRVYRAVHRRTGMEVAVKLIAHNGESHFASHFPREVQAHAGLVHPGVVYIFDYGIVDEEAAQAAAGLCEAGEAYVAMELATHETVRSLEPLSDWASVHHIASSVLDTLAYAHARGVIHRDLKPANLLLFADEEESLQVKIADFGIAHAFGSGQVPESTDRRDFSGTPYYMPPEQSRDEWRRYGPWTDLYALGCIVYQLVCGEPPFGGRNSMAIILDHSCRERPALKPLFEVPTGLEAWVQRMMAIRPEERFYRAADAAFALPPAPRSGLKASQAGPSKPAREPFWTLQTTMHRSGSEEHLPEETLKLFAATRMETAKTRLLPRVLERRPPLPKTWRLTHQKPMATPMVDTGLALFGLREAPFVNRDEERTVIWEALRKTVEERGVRIVFVAGESGTGKIPLVRWMARRAHEVGVATVMRAQHTAAGSSSLEGLSALVQEGLKAWRMSRSEVYAHLLEALPRLDGEDLVREVDARALTELIHPTEDDAAEVDGPRYHFSGPFQKFAVLTRFLRRVERQRLPVLWLDDVQWGPQTLNFLKCLLQRPEECGAALVLATVRSEFLEDSPATATELKALSEHERCTWLDLAPLTPAYHRELIARSLPLEPQLVEMLARRTEGNTLFVHHLLSDWIQTGSIEAGEKGFRLVRSAEISVPDDVHELLTARLMRLAARDGTGEVVTESLEVAAALGREVDETEWREVCALSGLCVPEDLVDRLVQRGIARRSADGWSFTHGLFVDSLWRSAREAGRLQDHHRSCAAMLEKRYPESVVPALHRRAEHWVWAGKPERALQPLLEESRALRALGEHLRSFQRLQYRERLLGELGLSADDARVRDNAIEMGFARLNLGELRPAADGFESVQPRCLEAGDFGAVSLICRGLANCYEALGEAERAERAFEQALESAIRAGDERREGEARLARGWAAFFRGELLEAKREYELARLLLERSGAYTAMFWCELYLGWLAITRKELGEARQLLKDLRRRSRERGLRPVEGECLNALGALDQLEGRFEEARKNYESSRQIAMETGPPAKQMCSYMNLVALELHVGNWEAARALFERTQQRFVESDYLEYKELFDCVRLALSSGLGDWAEFERQFARYEQGWPQNRPVLDEYPRLLRIAAQNAVLGGRKGHGEHLQGLAQLLSRRLGAGVEGVESGDEQKEV